MSTTNSYDGVVLRRIETDSDMFMCLDGIVLLCRRWKEGRARFEMEWKVVGDAAKGGTRHQHVT